MLTVPLPFYGQMNRKNCRRCKVQVRSGSYHHELLLTLSHTSLKSPECSSHEHVSAMLPMDGTAAMCSSLSVLLWHLFCSIPGRFVCPITGDIICLVHDDLLMILLVCSCMSFVQVLKEIGLGFDAELTIGELPVNYATVKPKLAELWKKAEPAVSVHGHCLMLRP